MNVPITQESGAVECVEILRTMRHGAMHPLLCRADDQALYVVKPTATGGNWALVMEWICARLGRLVDLPIPNYRQVEIREELADAWNAAHALKIEAGPGFGSQWIESATEAADTLLDQLDPVLTRRLLAFDWWVCNRDRSRKNPNLLWSADTRRYHVIDHDQAGQAENPDLFWRLHFGAGRRAEEAAWLPHDLRGVFRQALGHRKSIEQELPSSWTRNGEDIASFFAQLERALDDETPFDWRTHD